MRYEVTTLAAVALVGASACLSLTGHAQSKNAHSVQLGPRPLFLVNDMNEGPLKDGLLRCGSGPFKRTDFSIGHRGACLQFPEHTRESYEAAAVMGAGIVECDVTFTLDKELVCRHAQNDLATTTDILLTPLAKKCIKPFSPAGVAPNGTFIINDVLHWIQQEPAFGTQAVYLDDALVVADLPTASDLAGYKRAGINIVGSPIFSLLALGPGNYDAAISREGDTMEVLDVLAKDVGIIGIFSDWAATVSDYANCFNLK